MEGLTHWLLSPVSLLLLFGAALLLIREFSRSRAARELRWRHEVETAVQLRTKELEAKCAELMAAREALVPRAERDGLTGLWNRTAIFEILDRELERAKRGERPVAVILADLDHFKQINDTYGHATGDVVLVESARRLTCDLRTYDSTGRYGGEELLIVLSNCNATAAAARAEDLRARIENEPVQSDEHAIRITCSFGVAISSSRSSAADVVRAADEALYRAKRNGRNRVEAAWHPAADDEQLTPEVSLS